MYLVVLHVNEWVMFTVPVTWFCVGIFLGPLAAVAIISKKSPNFFQFAVVGSVALSSATFLAILNWDGRVRIAEGVVNGKPVVAYHLYSIGFRDGDYERIDIFDQDFDRRYEVGWNGRNPSPLKEITPRTGNCDAESCEGLFPSRPEKAEFKDGWFIVTFEDGSTDQWSFTNPR